MYTFKNLSEVADSRLFKSTNKLIFNGVTIDDALSDANNLVVTMNVSGRDVMQANLERVKPSARHGEIVTGWTLEPRILEIEMLVASKTNEDFRRLYERLNAILFNGAQSVISFSDEADRYYYGHFQASSTPKEDSNEQFITFTLFCGDPYKYTAKKTKTIKSAEVLALQTDFPVKPKIKLAYTTQTGAEVHVMNTTKSLRTTLKNTNIQTFKTFMFDYEEGTIYQPNTSVTFMDKLNIESDFEDFTVSNGDQIVIEPKGATITLEYRGVYL